jgi:hypothetical protein
MPHLRQRKPSTRGNDRGGEMTDDEIEKLLVGDWIRGML